MTTNYAEPVLNGEGATDYARYMRSDALLSLQRRPEDMVHRDELLFQTVHQSTELWLKLACYELVEAACQMRSGSIDTAIRLLTRASLAVEFITSELEMLRYLTPWDFQLIRTVLGHGSGVESPGWRHAQQCSRELNAAYTELLASQHVDLVEIYRGSPDAPLYRLAEALVEWDERISVWRARHYKVATRIIGHQVVGTKGMPVDALSKLISHKFFPELWQVRTVLTEIGPMGADAASAAAE